MISYNKTMNDVHVIGKQVLNITINNVDTRITWICRDQEYCLYFSETSNDLESKCTDIALPLGCWAYGDPMSNKIRMLTIPKKVCVMNPVLEAKYDKNVDCLMISLIGGKPFASKPVTFPSADYNFIFDVIDYRIVDIEVLFLKNVIHVE